MFWIGSVAAVYLAGMAGDIAEKKFGKRIMTASDTADDQPTASGYSMTSQQIISNSPDETFELGESIG